MAGATPQGVAVPNLGTFYQAPAGQRTLNPGADFVGGMNRGGSCAPGIGIATGEPNPKPDDWSRDARLLYESQALGQVGEDINVNEDPDFNNKVSFVQAVGAVAPGAVIANGAVNRTGQALVAGDWAWGVVPVA